MSCELHDDELMRVDGGFVIPAIIWTVVKIAGCVAGASFVAGVGYELIFG